MSETSVHLTHVCNHGTNRDKGLITFHVTDQRCGCNRHQRVEQAKAWRWRLVGILKGHPAAHESHELSEGAWSDQPWRKGRDGKHWVLILNEQTKERLINTENRLIVAKWEEGPE